jgi:hypothetical protein
VSQGHAVVRSATGLSEPKEMGARAAPPPSPGRLELELGIWGSVDLGYDLVELESCVMSGLNAILG